MSSFYGCLCFLIFISVSSISCAVPLVKRSANIKWIRDGLTNLNHVVNSQVIDVIYKNPKDTPLHTSNDITLKQEKNLQEIVYTTTHKYSGYVREYKNRHGGDISLAEALTQNPEDKSSFDMVLPITGTVTVLFSMGLLIALFQCCCRKRQTSDTEDVKSGEDKPVDAKKDSGDEEPKVEEKPSDDNQGSKEEEPVSIKSKIKAFEGVIPTQPSPGPIRPTKKRPDSNAFKALENKGIVYGMGKSPSRLSKTPEDENQNATLTQEETKPEEEPTHNDDLGGYKQPENPDVVIDDVDDDDEFGVIKRDTSVLRSYKKAPPPKNRNRSSAAVRRKRARETTTDGLFNDSSDNSFLNVPDDLEIVYTNDKTDEIQSNSTERNKNKSNKSDSMDKNKKDKKDKKDKNNSAERNKNNKDKKKTETEAPPSIVTSDYSSDSIIEIGKQEVPPEVFSGGNIFMHIDPTVKNKNVGKSEQKTETPPTTRLRNSQLSVEERKEKAKSTPLLSSHEDLAKALGKLRSPSKENNLQKSAGINRSSSDLSSNTKL